MSPSRPNLTRQDPLHLQVAKHLRNDIEAGLLRDGEVLPSTREMAAEWNVSVFTINEAMKTLIDDGLVVSKSRSKRVVHSPHRASRDHSRPDAPVVLLIGGYAGSGKTELGRTLARETGWPMLDKDTITRPVVEMSLQVLGLSPHDRESSEYLETVRPAEYACLKAAMLENVGCGTSAIVSAPFIREFKDEEWLTRTRAELADIGATAAVVWVRCDAETMEVYVRRRGAKRDAAKLSDWGAYVAGIDTNFQPATEFHTIDNSQGSRPLSDQARDLLDGVLQAESVR